MSNIKDILCSKCGEWPAHCDCEPHLKPFTFVSPSPRAIRMAEAYEPQELAEALIQREEELKEALEEKSHLLAVCAEYRERLTK